MISEKDVQELLSLTPNDITKDLMISYFAFTKKGNPRFKTNDKFIMPKGTMGVKEDTTTTVGRFIYNKFIIEPRFMDLLGYRNQTFTGGDIEDMEAELAEALMNDKIKPEDFIDYLNRIQWFGFSFAELVSPSMNYKTMVPLESVKKRRDELLKEHEEEINSGNAAIVGAKIEEELIKVAKEELKDDPSMDIYNSGARSKFSNHYKNQSIMRGPIVDNATGKYKVATSNYYDGIKKEEYNMFADMVTDGAYNRAVGTQLGGYQSKRLFAAFQSVVLDEPGTDCKSKNTLKILLTKQNKKMFLYRYIVEGNKLTLLDNENIDKYIDKVVHLRSPQFCLSEKLCSKCAGELYYKLGIRNIGLTTSKIGGNMLNLCLKKTHDVTLKLDTIDFRKYME